MKKRGGETSNIVLFSPLNIAEDEAILTSIFQMGWKHQLEKFLGCLGVGMKYYPVFMEDYSKLLQGSLLNNQDSVESNKGFSCGSVCIIFFFRQNSLCRIQDTV